MLRSFHGAAVVLSLALQLCCFFGPSEASIVKKVAASGRVHHLTAGAAAPSPCTRTDDYAEVGSSENDVCQEARLQLDVITQTLTKEKKIRDTFEHIFQSCGTGRHNIECVSRAAYADDPEDYMDMCNARMGPQATASGAVCRFAKMTLDQYRKSAFSYNNLLKILKWSQDSCKGVPYACVANSDACLDAPDVQFCFLECIKKGNMAHQMLAQPQVPDTNGCNCGDGIHACLDFSGDAPSPAPAPGPQMFTAP